MSSYKIAIVDINNEMKKITKYSKNKKPERDSHHNLIDC